MSELGNFCTHIAQSIGAFVKEETTLPKLKKKPTPGPGQYSPGRINSRSTPQFSFRVKHTEFSLFVPDTCEGEFLLS